MAQPEAIATILTNARTSRTWFAKSPLSEHETSRAAPTADAMDTTDSNVGRGTLPGITGEEIPPLRRTYKTQLSTQSPTGSEAKSLRTNRI